MSEIENVLDQLRRIYEGDAWHGPALRELLADVTAEQAAARPLPGAHSIWELVLHLAAWNNVFRRRLEGVALDEPEEGDFPPAGEPNAEAWERAQEKLYRAHERLIESVSNLPEARLEETVPGKDYSFRFMLAGIIRHDVYHSGQVAILRKAGDFVWR